MKHFDLNIDKILENWDLCHAVRELIANSLDESLLTNSKEPKIFKDEDGWWRIRDYGRGLRYQDLIQSENPEKIEHPSVIGKFGIGLKDALATFERKGIQVFIRSAHGDIKLARVSKHSFEDVVTLHASVEVASVPDIVGTECCLYGVPDAEVEKAKNMFLKFSDNNFLEQTKYGDVYKSSGRLGTIFINGMKVAEESNFLFSYNITSLTAPIKKALNRERQNLGRSAYSDRVRSILLECVSEDVINSLSGDLGRHSYGESHDELNWLDVQEHAVKILNSREKVLFVSPTDLIGRPDLIDDAVDGGYKVVTVSEKLTDKIEGITDFEGGRVTEISEFVRQRNDSFEFAWVSPNDLTPSEKSVWEYHDKILGFFGGLPSCVKDVRISETMSKDPDTGSDTVGLWMNDKKWIVIKRSQLDDLSHFAGTLLHEATHARFGVSDVSREFEYQLTRLIGTLSATAINEEKAKALTLVELARNASERAQIVPDELVGSTIEDMGNKRDSLYERLVDNNDESRVNDFKLFVRYSEACAQSRAEWGMAALLLEELQQLKIQQLRDF